MQDPETNNAPAPACRGIFLERRNKKRNEPFGFQSKPSKAAHSYYDTATNILQVRCFALLDTSQVILLSLSASAPIQLTPRAGRGRSCCVVVRGTVGRAIRAWSRFFHRPTQ